MRHWIAPLFAILVCASAQAQYWSQSTVPTDIYSTNTGNVGIGTPSPQHKLTVAAAGGELFALDNSSGAQTGANTSQLFKFGGASWVSITTTMTSPTQADLIFKTRNGTEPVERMRLTGSGNLAIGDGTLTPAGILHVYGSWSGSLSPILFENASPTATAMGMLFKVYPQVLTAGILAGKSETGGTLVFRTWGPNAQGASPAFRDRAWVRSNGELEIGLAGDAQYSPLRLVVNGTSTLNGTATITGTMTATTVNASGTVTAASLVATGNGSVTGNLGVGTSSPTSKLHVVGNAYVTGTTTTATINASGTVTAASLVATANGVVTGNMGIGTSSPTSKLHVVGNAYVTGGLTVDGNIAAKYQDVAEWVPSTMPLADASVVILDDANIGAVTLSTTSYDTRVAGVVSPQPGLLLGEAGENKAKIATTGRVKVKVTTSNGPIAVGDLIVTSDQPGVAMKSTPVDVGGVRLHRPGTLLGKAIEPLAEGDGEILVLLSLQ